MKKEKQRYVLVTSPDGKFVSETWAVSEAQARRNFCREGKVDVLSGYFDIFLSPHPAKAALVVPALKEEKIEQLELF